MIQRFIKQKLEKQKLEEPCQANDANLFQKPQKPTKNPKHLLAKTGELYAQNFLKDLGWTIKEKNWRTGRFAEIDIIAVDPQGMLVFVEVKSRRTPKQTTGFINSGFDSLNEHKRRKIVTCASIYLAKHRLQEKECRFDALVLYYQDSSSVPQVHHISNIF